MQTLHIYVLIMILFARYHKRIPYMLFCTLYAYLHIRCTLSVYMMLKYVISLLHVVPC